MFVSDCLYVTKLTRQPRVHYA